MLLIFIVPETYSLTIIAHHNQIVGQSLTLECSVTTVRGITSRVDIVWSSDGTILKQVEKFSEDFTRLNLDTYTTTYTVSPLTINDNGKTFQCDVAIRADPPLMDATNVTLAVNGVLWNEHIQ